MNSDVIWENIFPKETIYDPPLIDLIFINIFGLILI